MTLASFEAVLPAHVPSLVMKQDRPLTKHAIKSKATRDALLQAAEQIFARDGYERAQIDEIAQLSGRTRGAVYAQYKTKEQLFFAVQERQIETAKAEVQKLLLDTDDYAERLSRLREYYSGLRDPRAGLLDLELKLYAIRHPESAASWADRYTRTYGPGSFDAEFGLVQLPGRSKLNSRALALASLKTALILTMEFLPDHLPRNEAKLLLKEVFDGLFPPDTVRNSAPKKKARVVRKKGANA